MTTRVWAQNPRGSNRSPSRRPPIPPRRRLLRRLLSALLGLGGLLAIVAPAAAASVTAATTPAAPAPTRPRVDVIQVSGLLDPLEVDFVERSLARAEARGTDALVIQLNSTGAVVGRARVDAFKARIAHARLPVAVWVGPTRARALHEAAELVAAAAIVGRAPGTRLGGPCGRAANTCGGPDGVVRTPTLGDFILSLDGATAGGHTISIPTKVVHSGRILRRQPDVDVRFAKLGLLQQLLHTVSSPQVAYLLLVVGLVLAIFEFFTAGVGIAGAVGAASLVLGAYGLGALPTRPIAVVLIVVGMAGFAIDVQTGVPRFWTVVGTIALVVGSLTLYRGHRVGWIAVVLVVAGVALAMVAGMAAMLRARFSTPTIGREAMIGEMGAATTGISPDGTVELRGGLWRARTNRATPIAAGAAVRVVAIDGLVLEVEPEAGGARDAGH